MKNLPECIPALERAGISRDDAITLRKIAMTLHRWHELECGDSNDYASWCIVRLDRNPNKDLDFQHADDGKPYIEKHSHKGAATWNRIADREAGAKRRLARVMKNYPEHVAYVQTDPRGASLYILRKSDVPQGADIGSIYNRGVAVYK